MGCCRSRAARLGSSAATSSTSTTLASQAMLARKSQLAGLDLEVCSTLATAPTAGDPRLIERLIANLIDNAIWHNTPGGYVEITTGIRDRHAFVSIANTGPTIAPEQIQRLFQPFQRLGGARTQHNTGHGLGLSIVQAIANAHHTELTVDARPEGGLTIEISFPPTNTPPGPKGRCRWLVAGVVPRRPVADEPSTRPRPAAQHNGSDWPAGGTPTTGVSSRRADSLGGTALRSDNPGSTGR